MTKNTNAPRPNLKIQQDTAKGAGNTASMQIRRNKRLLYADWPYTSRPTKTKKDML